MSQSRYLASAVSDRVCARAGFLTATSDNLFRTVFELQPRDSGAGGGVTVTREEKVHLPAGPVENGTTLPLTRLKCRKITLKLTALGSSPVHAV